MKKSNTFILFVSVFIVNLMISTASYAKSNDLLIYIQSNVYNAYQEIVGKNDVLNMTSFLAKDMSRDVVDIIIAQQALKLGGFNHKLSYAPSKVNLRNVKMLKSGDLLISFDTYWKANAQVLAEKTYISDPVIRQGEYIAGIYTSPSNHKVLQVKKLEDLKELTAISTPLWITDWKTLQSFHLKKLIKENSWVSMARMVNMQWVDFMLIPFSTTPDQSIMREKINLVPVKGVAVVLKDSRHFVISKAHPQGEEAYVAINKGLKILRERGMIKKAYTEAGLFVDTKKYKVLNL